MSSNLIFKIMKHARSDYDRIQDPAGLIPEDEPVFLLRGQDSIAPDLLRQWSHQLLERGGSGVMAEMVMRHAEAMLKWQREHKKKVPDLPLNFKIG
jgi:hypothetical protein